MKQDLLNWISITGRLLGSIFYYDPYSKYNNQTIEFFKTQNWQEQLGINDSNLDKLIKTGIEANLAEQYQYLFIGPTELPAPPWGSVYLDPESVIFGNSLLKLQKFLNNNSISFDTKNNDPEDHVGLMLMLSAYIVEHKPTLIKEFLTDHFFIWVYRYLDLLSKQDHYPFYQGIALLTVKILDSWKEELHITIPSVHLYR